MTLIDEVFKLFYLYGNENYETKPLGQKKLKEVKKEERYNREGNGDFI